MTDRDPDRNCHPCLPDVVMMNITTSHHLVLQSLMVRVLPLHVLRGEDVQVCHLEISVIRCHHLPQAPCNLESIVCHRPGTIRLKMPQLPCNGRRVVLPIPLGILARSILVPVVAADLHTHTIIPIMIRGIIVHPHQSSVSRTIHLSVLIILAGIAIHLSTGRQFLPATMTNALMEIIVKPLRLETYRFRC